MDRRKQDLLLGIVFFVGLAGLLWATYNLTRIGGTPSTMQMFFPNGAGLRKGDSVFVLGIRLGEVTAVDYLGRNPEATKVRVAVELDSPVVLRDDYTITIRNQTVLGGKIVEIDPGTGAELAPEVPIAGRVSDSLMADLLDQPDIKRIVDGVTRFVDTLNSGEGALHLIVSDAEFRQQLTDTVDSLARTVQALETGEGTLRKLIHDPDTARQIDNVIASVETFTANLNDPAKGLVGRLTNDPQLNTDLDDLVADLRRFTAAVNDLENGGIVAQLVHDSDLKRQVGEVVDDIEAAADKLNDPEAGLLGRIISDGELSASTKRIVDNIDKIAQDLRDQRGLLGQLIADEEMGRQFARILNQVSRAIEDAREAAPIGTFIQVVAGVF